MGATICGCKGCRIWVSTYRLEVWPRAWTMKSKSLIDFISKFIQMPFTPICRCFTISVPFQVDRGYLYCIWHQRGAKGVTCLISKSHHTGSMVSADNLGIGKKVEQMFLEKYIFRVGTHSGNVQGRNPPINTPPARTKSIMVHKCHNNCLNTPSAPISAPTWHFY